MLKHLKEFYGGDNLPSIFFNKDLIGAIYALSTTGAEDIRRVCVEILIRIPNDYFEKWMANSIKASARQLNLQ